MYVLYMLYVCDFVPLKSSIMYEKIEAFPEGYFWTFLPNGIDVENKMYK